MVKVDAFPFLREIKDYDFTFQSSVNQQQILEFATLRFMNFPKNNSN